MKKRPKSENPPAPRKTVREAAVPFIQRLVKEELSVVLVKQAVSLPIKPRMPMRMEWTTELKDILGRWSWGQSRHWGKDTWKRMLLPFLRECQKKRWSEIEMEKSGDDKRYKTYEVFEICNEAQKRLTEIEIDIDAISRFRLGSERRLYGFTVQHVFFVLWWDPDHKIYPTDVQNRGKIRQR